MDQVLSALMCHHVFETSCPSSGGSNGLVSYNFRTGIVKRYMAKRIVLLKCQKVDNGPVVILIVPAIDVSCIPDVTRRRNAEAERDYRLYGGVTDDAPGQLADAQAVVVNYLDAIFAQETL